MRRLKKSDFENKTIVKANVKSSNVVSLTFSDGTELSIWAELFSVGGYGTLAQLLTEKAKRKNAKHKPV
jgi:hypothetical protein